MAPEPRPCDLGGDGLACLESYAGVDPVASCRPAYSDNRAPSSGFGRDRPVAGVCSLDNRPIVLSDRVAIRGDFSERPENLGSHQAYLAALLAPLSGLDAAEHATALLARFGSISGIGAARVRELAEVFGPNSGLPTQIAAVRRLLAAGIREHVSRRPLDPADPALLNFVVTRFSGLKYEELLVMFGDDEGRFLDSETIGAGQTRIEIAPARLFRRAIALSATQVILAHNHPSGSARPSEDDIAATRRIVRDGRLLGIILRDHLIVGGNAVFSMRNAGLL